VREVVALLLQKRNVNVAYDVEAFVVVGAINGAGIVEGEIALLRAGTGSVVENVQEGTDGGGSLKVKNCWRQDVHMVIPRENTRTESHRKSKMTSDANANANEHDDSPAALIEDKEQQANENNREERMKGSGRTHSLQANSQKTKQRSSSSRCRFGKVESESGESGEKGKESAENERRKVENEGKGLVDTHLQRPVVAVLSSLSPFFHI
jgi:hypothetical protein